MLHNPRSLLTHPDVIRSIRAAYLVADLGNGGQERQLYNLVTNLQSEGFKLVVPWDFNLEDKYLSLLKENSSVIVLNLTEEHGILAKVRVLRGVLKLTNADFLHSYSFHLNFVSWLCTLFLKPKAIGGIRSRLVLNRSSHGMLRFYLSFLFPYYKISNNYTCFKGLDKLSLAIAKVFNKTHFVHNGIDLDRFHQNKVETIHESDLLKSVSVGRLHPVKKVENIVDWVYRLKQQNIPVSHQHAGYGPHLQLIEDRIIEFGLEKEFSLIGDVRDIPKLLQQSDLFVHAAQHEGCPNVVMEAMACGLPVLASNAGDMEYIVDQGETGYVYQVDDQETMLKYSLSMIENPDRLKEMGQSGATKAQTKFGIAQYVTAILQTYQRMGINI
jgi:glycosyltransferase involved in cell wall biosynthesis